MNRNETKTKDLMEAAFLEAAGMDFLRVEPNGNGDFYFVFENRGECEELSSSYWSGKAMVNAREFTRAVRDFKDIIFRNK
ncbi:MAG: DUF5659 domain-containing protein [Candidatus Omnitrophota bacterium]